MILFRKVKIGGVWRKYIWFALGILFLGLRFQNAPGVFTSHGIAFNDTDPYYRLHRIEQMVKSDLTYPLHDEMLSFPNGFDVPWPLGLDLLVATPLKLFGVTDTQTIEAYSAILIPLLAFPGLILVGASAYLLFGSTVAFASALLFTLSPSAIYKSSIGRLDHHFLEALCVILVFWLLLLFRKGRKGAFLSLALVLGLAPAFWPQAWVLGLFLALSALLDSSNVKPKSLGRLFLFSSILNLILLALTDRFTNGLVSPFGFSWWTPLFFGAASASFHFWNAVKRHSRSTSWFALSLMYLLALLGWVFFHGGFGTLVSIPSQMFHTVTGSQGLLSITNEAISPLRLHPATWLPLGLGPLFIAWIGLLQIGLKRSSWWIGGFALGPMVLALLQARFVGLAMPLVAILSAWIIHHLIQKKVSSRKWQILGTFLLLFLIILPARPELGWTHRENTHPLYRPIRQLGTFLRSENKLHPRPVDQRAVSGHWDFGHWLLYYGHVPVVSHPFQSLESFETLQMFCSESEKDFQAYMEKYPVNYLVVEGPNRRIRKWLDFLGRDLDSYFASKTNDQGGTFLQASPKTLKLQTLRFFVRNGKNEEGVFPTDWRLLYVSPFANPDDQTTSALKLFERVPGARLYSLTNEPSLTLEGKIFAPNESFTFSQTAHANEEGLISWTVPYAQMKRGNVAFSGKYVVRNQEGKSQSLPLTVTENAIYNARSIDLGTLNWE